MKGKRITTLKQLMKAAYNRRAVICDKTYFQKHTPAAFMIGLQGRYLQRLFDCGMFLYEGQKRRAKREG